MSSRDNIATYRTMKGCYDMAAYTGIEPKTFQKERV